MVFSIWKIFRPNVYLSVLVALAMSSMACTEVPPVSRAELLTATVKDNVEVQRILTHRIEMAPQIAGQKHYHPMPVIGYVVAGKIAFHIEGEALQILDAGDAFFEPANAVVSRWENIGSTRAIFVANYIAAAGDHELLIRID